MTVRLARRVTFSAGHRYWSSDASEEENRALFGAWASPYNHGHNYVLVAEAEGEVDPGSGMVVNIKEIDDVLDRDVIAELDGKSLNDEIPYFAARAPTLENLLRYIRSRLVALPRQVRLCKLRLDETETLYAELELGDSGEETIMTLTRSYEFAASHRLHNPALSPEENILLFGKCNNLAGHGHNYVVEVTVRGEPDARTGMIADLGALDEVVNREIVDRYDHKHLNEDLPEFQGRMTTTEALALEIWDRLLGKVPAELHRVRVFETARNMFEVGARS